MISNIEKFDKIELEKKHGIVITKRERGNHRNAKVIYKSEGFTLHNFIKWSWYFEYLHAKAQVENPKKFKIEISKYHLEIEAAEKKRIFLKNRIVSAKRKITEWRRKIEKFEKSYNLLFPITENKSYQAAIQKFESKKALLENLTNQYETEFMKR